MSVWLAIDTATEIASVALVVDELREERTWRAGRSHTVELATTIDGMLKRADLTVDRLDGIAVAIGPGSYTGLRVGLAVAKGMALPSGVPIAGVPTLDTLAAALSAPTCHRSGVLHAFLRAGRKRYAVATYPPDRDAWPEPDTIRSWELSSFLDATPAPGMVAGELSTDDARRCADAGFAVVPPAAGVRRAAHLAALGAERACGGLPDPDALVPVYLGRGPG